jgi:hypothetical protein
VVSRSRLNLGRGGVGKIRRDGEAETSHHLRQLVDGIESAVAQGDDLALAQFLAPPLLGRMLAASAAIRAAGGSLVPARSGLSWRLSHRKPAGPGRCWLRLRFEDLTLCRYPEAAMRAPGRAHELEVDLETTVNPWRLHQLVEVTFS